MNWDAIGAIGEIVGATAVLITLVAIYLQQRKVHALALAENQREALVTTTDLFDFIATHPTALESVRSCLQNFDDATPREQADFGRYAHMSINMAEQALYLYKEKLINHASYVGMEGVALMLLVTPGGEQWWSKTGVAFGADIRNQLENVLSERRREILPAWHYFPHLGAALSCEQHPK